MPTLYIVATPIGNLEDITLRALRILKEVDLILCEDTRVTKRLLQKYDISTPTMSYHAQSKLSKVEKIIDLLEEGRSLALVSDAGTPTISDPGCMLVSQIRKHFKELDTESTMGSSILRSVEIVPVPGPSAVLSALSVSGFPSSEFTFLGFLPHKKGRETMFRETASTRRTVVFYDSPHRIDKALDSLAQFLGPAQRICVSREITKIHEEHFIGTAGEAVAHYKEHPDRLRGEFVVVVEAL